MIERLKQLALGTIGVITALAKRVLGGAPASSNALKLLHHLATHTSAPVPELSSKAKLSSEETLRLLTELEERGFVQLSGDQGAVHERIAAITKAGREQIAGGRG